MDFETYLSNLTIIKTMAHDLAVINSERKNKLSSSKYQ